MSIVAKILFFMSFSGVCFAQLNLISVDADKILEIAENAAYEKFPELKPGALKLESNHIFVSCYSNSTPPIITHREGCSSSINYMITDTYKEQIIQLENGQCRKEKEYSSIHVRVESNGSTHVDGPGNSSGSSTTSCGDFDI